MSMQSNTHGSAGHAHGVTPLHSVSLVGTIHIPQTGSEAFRLFTATGERAWAHGWDPRFPVAVDDDSTPGTVFTVAHQAVDSVWLVCRRDDERLIQYVRVIPGKNAGTVTVTLEPDANGSVVTVEYVLTPLDQEAAAELAEFAAHYDVYLQSWEKAILSSTSASSRTD